jgi:hypothetical protein
MVTCFLDERDGLLDEVCEAYDLIVPAAGYRRRIDFQTGPPLDDVFLNLCKALKIIISKAQEPRR